MRHFSFKSSKPICEANEAPSKLYTHLAMPSIKVSGKL